MSAAPAPDIAAIRRATIRLVKTEADTVNPTGCVWCDIGKKRMIAGHGAYIHEIRELSVYEDGGQQRVINAKFEPCRR